MPAASTSLVRSPPPYVAPPREDSRLLDSVEFRAPGSLRSAVDGTSSAAEGVGLLKSSGCARPVGQSRRELARMLVEELIIWAAGAFDPMLK